MSLKNPLTSFLAAGFFMLGSAVAGPMTASWESVGEMLSVSSEELGKQLAEKRTKSEARRSIPIALALSASFDQLPALSEAARTDRDARVRESAVVALGYLGRLIRSLGDTLPGIGGEALAGVTATLSETLKDKNPVVRNQSAAALASIGVAVGDTFEALVDLLEETEEHSVQEAALALGHFHKRLDEAKAALQPRLADKREAVRVSAAAALIRLGVGSDPARATLSAGLTSVHSDAREAAVSALALFEGPGIIPALWKALDDNSAGVRIAAASALESIGASARITGARLTRALKHDRSPGVRAASALALARVQGQEAIPALSAALDQNRGEVGAWASVALASLGVPGANVLHRATKGPSARARRNASIGLGLLTP